MRTMRAIALTAVVLLGAAAGHALAGIPDEYAERFAEAARLEAEGGFADAAAALEPLRAEYPDDYALFLQLGWLHFQDGAFGRAEPAYRRAAEISAGAQDAQLGLAWSLLELGEFAEAESLFRALLAGSPDLELARAGLSRIEVDRAIRADVRFAYIAHSGHITRGTGWAVTAGLDVPFAEQWVATGHFRFTRLENAPDAADDLAFAQASGPGGGGGNGGGGGGIDGGGAGLGQYDQQEVYVSTGVRRRAWGLLGHFAYVHDEGEFVDDLFAFGASVRISRVGDLWLEASVTLYPDDPFVRVSPWWRIDLGRGFYLRPGGALQVVQDAAVIGNGFLEVGWQGRYGSLWIGGKGGRERRPTYLLIPLVFNLSDDIRWGVWAGGALRLGSRAVLRASYELQELEYRTDAGLGTSPMHVVSIAATLAF